MHIQESHWSSASTIAPGGAIGSAGGNGRGDGVRSTPLRVDAQRNLEHVLRAAREVFGELGYGAPMEDVARRARVGVGTVYRRFPSKDVLVRRIAEEETSRLTEQARVALGQEEDPWQALSRFLRTSVASGAGRLLPPQVLRVGVAEGQTVGVGMPISVTFARPVPKAQRDVVERQLKVSVDDDTEGTEGGWGWVEDRALADGQRVDFRPRTSWRPGTKITVEVGADLVRHFTVGPR